MDSSSGVDPGKGGGGALGAEAPPPFPILTQHWAIMSQDPLFAFVSKAD